MAQPVGSLLGYQIVLKGDARYAGQHQVWDLPTGIPVVTGNPEVALERRLSQFTLDSIMRLVGGITAVRLWHDDLFEQQVEAAARGFDPKMAFLPFLMRRVIREAIVRRVLPDQAVREMTAWDLKAVEDAVWALTPQEDLAGATTQSAKWSLFLRMMQAQYTDQFGAASYKMETVLALDTVVEAKSLGLDLDDVFHTAYGCTFRDICFISFALSATVASDPMALLDRTSIRAEEFGLTSDAVDAYWQHCAIKYDEFAREAVSPRVLIPGYDSYALSPTVKWPLVILDSGLAAVPIAGDLLYRSSHGFVIDALQALRKNNMDSGTFNRARGRAFEKYVGMTLKASRGAGGVYHADELFPDDISRCDWISVSEAKNVLLVESKAIWFHLDADMTKERSVLKKEIARDGSLADAVEQLYRSAEAIRLNRTCLRKNSNLMGLVVLSGHQVGLNGPLIGELIDEILNERGVNSRLLKYQIANDEGFARLAALHREGGSLWRSLRTKWESRATRITDMQFAGEAGSEEDLEHPLEDEHDSKFWGMIGTYSERLAEDLAAEMEATSEAEA